MTLFCPFWPLNSRPGDLLCPDRALLEAPGQDLVEMSILAYLVIFPIEKVNFCHFAYQGSENAILTYFGPPFD